MDSKIWTAAAQNEEGTKRTGKFLGPYSRKMFKPYL